MGDKPSILLVNPPIYDFAAFDFWLKPLGMLAAAGRIGDQCNFQLFDFLYRNHEFYKDKPQYRNDEWGRGKFFSVKIPKPQVFDKIPRYFQRFGLPCEIFVEFLKTNTPADFVFVQTVMTYWYPGYKEVIETVRKHWPKAKIVLGGPYTKICPEHAKELGADLIDGEKDDPAPDGISETASHGVNSVLAGLTQTPTTGVGAKQLPKWELYKNPETAAMKITRGCPYKCTYCAVPIFGENFSVKPLTEVIEELSFLVTLGVRNIAFYDDALLYKSDDCLKPFLRYVIENKIKVSFHTPNALNARFIDEELARLMVKAGFKSFYLGFESRAGEFQKQTGAKVFDKEFADTAGTLIAAGVDKNSIIAYLVFGHPSFETQGIEESMEFANKLGVKIMFASFSPIPGTPDGKLCEKYVDMNEPLMHNKTAFPIILLGSEKVNQMKEMCRKLNERKLQS